MKEKSIEKHKQKIKSIAVLTSGGDAPGMNAAIRAVVRTGICNGAKVFGVERGYSGLISGSFIPFELAGVANIIQRGGTILKSNRCEEFKKKPYRQKAINQLKENNIDALVCIGGDGTFHGCEKLWNEFGFPIAGVPGTIDNDLYGTDITIGFDTATNTGLRAIDQIRDTASSHDRLFIIEVMGRNSGYIAMDVGIGGGADAIVVPEKPMTTAAIVKQIRKGMDRGKTSSIIVVAEGKKSGNSMQLAETLKSEFGYSPRVCILGHVQRGGSPSARDRKVASVMGSQAVNELMAGHTNFMTGIQGRQSVLVPIPESIKKRKWVRSELFELAQVLAT